MAASCGVATPTTPTTPATVTGGAAGDLDVTENITKGIETDDLKEGDEDVKVVGLKLEAIDSDISVTNVKVMFTNSDITSPVVGSEKLSNYIDEVKVFLGDEEVGSADASDFSKNSVSLPTGNDEYTKSISLSGAVVKEGDVAYLYVAVTTNESIDSDDVLGDLDVTFQTLRYTDGTGAIMSADEEDIDNTENFGFTDDEDLDDLTIKSSSANPAESTIAVSNDDATDDVLIGAFKLEVDEDSNDITVLEIPISVTFADNTVATEDNFAGDIITDLYITIDGEEYSADLDDSDDATAASTNGGVAIYRVDLEDEDIVIATDDTVEVKIYASFASMDDEEAYSESTTIDANIAAGDISAEGADEFNSDGTFNGKVHTLSSVDLDVTKSSSTASYVDSDDNTTVEYVLEVKVANNSDEDIYIPLSAFDSFYMESTSGAYASGTAATVLSVEADDSDIETAAAGSIEGYFTVSADSDEVIILKGVLDNGGLTAGSYRLAIDEMSYTTDDTELDDENPQNDLSTLEFTAVKSTLKYAGNA